MDRVRGARRRPAVIRVAGAAAMLVTATDTPIATEVHAAIESHDVAGPCVGHPDSVGVEWLAPPGIRSPSIDMPLWLAINPSDPRIADAHAALTPASVSWRSKSAMTSAVARRRMRVVTLL